MISLKNNFEIKTKLKIIKNFFQEVKNKNFFLKKWRSNIFNSKIKDKDLETQNGKSDKKIFVQNCEIIPGNFFCFYFSPLLKTKFSKYLIENLVSITNLYYLQKNFSFCKFKFLKKKKFQNEVFFFEGVEPKTKNLFFLNPEKKKTDIKVFSDLLNFKSGKNFQKKENFLKNLENLEYCSNFKIKIKPVKIENESFLDFYLDFDENSSFSIKPLLKFDFSELSSSLMIKEYNFLQKGIKVESQLEIKKPIWKSQNLSFSILSEFKKKKLLLKNNCCHFFKPNKFLKIFDYQIIHKTTKNLENNFKTEILQEKNKAYPYLFNQISFSTFNKIFLPEKNEIYFKTHKNLGFQHFFEDKIDFSFAVKNPIKFFPISKKSFSYKIVNENFFGNLSCLNEPDLYNSCQNYCPKISIFENNISKKSSLGIEKNLQGIISKIFFISEASSLKRKNKIQSTINFIAGIKIKNFISINLWANNSGKKGIMIGF